MHRMRVAPIVFLLPLACAGPRSGAEPRPLYQQSFGEPAALAGMVFTDPAAWRWSDAGGTPSLELFTQSQYEPPYRSPINIALLPVEPPADYVLELEAMQTGPEYPHRDLILVFGWQSRSRFCYAHLGAQPDENSQNIFLVDEAPRRPMAPVGTQSIDWGQDAWHTLRLECRGGRARVWFDGRLVLQADGLPLAGRAGFGSFDDTGRFRNVRIVPIS